MATTMRLIAKQTLGSTATTIDFQNIPASYTDLLVCASLRATYTGQSVDTITLRFNNSTTNYSERDLYGNGSAATSISQTVSYLDVGRMPASNATSNTFSNIEVYIPNYAGSTNKSVSTSAVMENNATLSYIWASAGLWSNTSAIDRITIGLAAGTNIVANSSVFIYGITKA